MKKIKLFKNFGIGEYFSHLAFPVGLILISFTIGIEYFFLAVISCFFVFAVVGISIGVVAFLDFKDVPGPRSMLLLRPQFHSAWLRAPGNRAPPFKPEPRSLKSFS